VGLRVRTASEASSSARARASAALYLNATDGTSPADVGVQWIVPQLKQLVRVVGSQAAPVADVTLAGLTVRDAAFTYMDEWGV
jgi:hypothetical protein